MPFPLNEMNDPKNYELSEQLGEGGFGVVHAVRNKTTDEIFAAKISSKYIYLNNHDDSLFLRREIESMHKFNHPAILRFHGFSEKDFSGQNHPVLFMEYAANGSLYQYIKKEQSSVSELNATKQLICIFGVASAMKYLHSHRILHRDLKPENILLTKDFLPKLSDFGLVKPIHLNASSITPQSNECMLKGTWRYLAPETFEDNIYSEATDVYAFSMIVYAIMTSEIPFKDLKWFQIGEKVTQKIRPDFSDKPIGEAYRNLIERCWSHIPEERPTFESIVEELKCNGDFITDEVDKIEFQNYIHYIETYPTTFNESKRIESTPSHLENSTQKSDQSITDLKHEADNGNLNAMNEYAVKLIKGEGVSLNKEEASRYYKMAADKGHIDAQYNYANMLKKGEGIKMNEKEACRYYKMAADKGHIDAMYRYGFMLSKGEGVSINKEESCRYYKMAADKGSKKAMNNYGFMLENGEGVSMNIEEACRYYKMAADKGSKRAMNTYANMLKKGEGVSMNKKDACRYYKMAAEKGHIYAMNNYAVMLENGEGVRINKEEACRYYKMAADKGNKNAMNRYGLMLSKGEGVSLNKEEACRYIKMAADKGNIKAMNNYGSMLKKGEGVSMNKEEACRYFKMAADKGNQNAMFNYALMLVKGEGVTMSKEEACRYFKMAADKGQIDAQYNYANMLKKGEGVGMNEEEAYRYYKMAAEKGHLEAISLLNTK